MDIRWISISRRTPSLYLAFAEANLNLLLLNLVEQLDCLLARRVVLMRWWQLGRAEVLEVFYRLHIESVMLGIQNDIGGWWPNLWCRLNMLMVCLLVADLHYRSWRSNTCSNLSSSFGSLSFDCYIRWWSCCLCSHLRKGIQLEAHQWARLLRQHIGFNDVQTLLSALYFSFINFLVILNSYYLISWHFQYLLVTIFFGVMTLD